MQQLGSNAGNPLGLSESTVGEGNRCLLHQQTDGFLKISVPGLYDMTTVD